MIIRGSSSVSGNLLIPAYDASSEVRPLDLTGMTLAARWWDVGHIGYWRNGGWDYGAGPSLTNGPLLEVPQWDGVEEKFGVLVVADDPTTGTLYFSLRPGQTEQLWCRSIAGIARGRRQLVRQIWRTDAGYESMLREDVDWCRA